MKINNLILKYVWMPLIAGTFASCQTDNVDDIEFGVSADKTTVTVGEAVRFRFDGNPDYISFYPGTKTCNYANRERTRIEGVDSVGMSCKIEQVYTELKAYKDQQLLTACVSTDFTGVYTPENIAAATWKAVEGLKMPVSATANVTIEYTEADLREYLDKDFYVAFQYKAGPNTIKESNYGKPRIQIKLLTLAKRDPDKYVYKDEDVAYGWGFQTVLVQTQPKGEKYDITESMLSFFPDKDTEKDKDVEAWMISKKLNAATIEPDRGTPIKSTNARLPYYEFRYDRPGTYKATFIATNANMWNSKQAVREVTITVNETTAE